MFEKIKKDLAKTLAPIIDCEESDVVLSLEYPKNLDHGHLSYPVFGLAKKLKKAPPLIANELAAKIPTGGSLKSVSAVGGYLNFSFENLYLQQTLNIETQSEKIGFQPSNGKRIVIDYSSPNVAKPMSIGHLRATVIGQAIRNLAESQGYSVTGLNYLGDWGVQFGKLAYAYLKWPEGQSSKYDFNDKPFEALFKLYVDFHSACEADPELEKQGALTFKKLEEGDAEIQAVWKKFLDISLNEYERIYKILNVKFDLIQGESFYNDKMEKTVDQLKEKGLLVESDGAQVVFIDDNTPPCIIKKSDGATLYATRDITSAYHRHFNLKGDELLYVVGVDQTLHFRQVFSVLEKMGNEWAKNCHHIAFGMYRFKDMGKMSTRRGNVIFMDDVLERAIELANSIIEEKNPSLEDKAEVAQKVGVGAILFHDLVTDRVKNIDFDWERVLDFEGDSGPYVQYCAVRCQSLMRKYGQDIPFEMNVSLESKEERELIRTLLMYSDTLKASYKSFRPSVLAQYLLDICKCFSSFYAQHKILDDTDQGRVKARMRLVQCTHKILVQGLLLLGIQTPDRM